MVSSGRASARNFICANCPRDTPMPLRFNNQQAYDFADNTYLSYSYQLMFTKRGTTAATLVPAFPVNHSFSSSGMAILADRNPLITFGPNSDGGGVMGTVFSANVGLKSPNHDGDGQSVAFADGHAVFSGSSSVGVGGDNIYTAWIPKAGGGWDVAGALSSSSLPKGEVRDATGNITSAGSVLGP